MTKSHFESFDKKMLALCSWGEESEAKAFVEIIHSRHERAERYSSFGDFLAALGYYAYAPDLRGHGETDENNLGEGSKECFTETVKDLGSLNRDLLERHPKTPLFVIGHGWGTFLALALIERFKGVSGVVLGGAYDFSLYRLYSLISKVLGLEIGRNRKSKLFNRMICKKYAYSAINETNDDMSTYAGKYPESFDYTSSFLSGYLKGAIKSVKKSSFESVSDELPVLIASGKADLYGNITKAPKKLRNLLEEMGFQGVEMKLYQGGHDFLFDKDSDYARADIAEFIEKRI